MLVITATLAACRTSPSPISEDVPSALPALRVSSTTQIRPDSARLSEEIRQRFQRLELEVGIERVFEQNGRIVNIWALRFASAADAQRHVEELAMPEPSSPRVGVLVLHESAREL